MERKSSKCILDMIFEVNEMRKLFHLDLDIRKDIHNIQHTYAYMLVPICSVLDKEHLLVEFNINITYVIYV